MKRAVEVSHFINGELTSTRLLSLRQQRQGAVAALLGVAILGVVGMTGAALLVHTLGRGLYTPWFLMLWASTLAALSALAIKAVRRRLSRYALGSRLDADAFAAVSVDLVRRREGHFELTLVPGMRGSVSSGRIPMPVEALVKDRPVTLTLDPGVTAELTLGSSTFVVRDVQGVEANAPVGRALSRELVRSFWRTALAGAQIAVVGSLFCAVPVGLAIGDRAAHLVSPRITTPWEAEKWLRIEAQSQSRSLHQCFDPLPLSCQHPGYVGVGVSLTRDGEIRSNWIARSTYGTDCPVDQCMKDVVSTWIFDPLPEPMRVVLPVQVLRTEKPLPGKTASAAATGAGAGPRVAEVVGGLGSGAF